MLRQAVIPFCEMRDSNSVRNFPNHPQFCNTPSTDGSQLTTTPHFTRTHHHCLYTHAPRRTNSATTSNTLQNPKRRKTPSTNIPSKKPAPVADSCIDLRSKMCILMSTSHERRHHVSPTKLFDNSSALNATRLTIFFASLRTFVVAHNAPSPHAENTPLPSQKGRKKHLTCSECSECSLPTPHTQFAALLGKWRRAFPGRGLADR